MKLLSHTKGPRIKSLKFELRDIDIEEKQHIEVFCDIEHTPVVDDKHVSVALSVSIGGEKSIFSIDLTTETIFKIVGEATEDKIMESVYLEAAPVVYIATSNMVAELTFKAHQPPLYLPSVDFEVFYKKKLKVISPGKNIRKSAVKRSGTEKK